MPSNALIIRETLKSSGAKAAENQLALIGSDHGDEQLAIVVAELSDAEIGQFLNAADYTKPSIVTHFITPEQLLGSLERVGARWGSLKGSNLNALISIKRQVSDCLFPVLLHAEPGPKKKYLDALIDHKLGWDVLVTLPLFEHGCPEFLVDFDANQNQHGTWQEVYSDIQAADPKEFKSLRAEVLGLFKKDIGDDDEAETEAEEESTTASRQAGMFLLRTYQKLADRAATLVENDPPELRSEDVFADL